MNINVRNEAEEFVQNLVGKSLKYGQKFGDTELYDLGFGPEREIEFWDGEKRILPEYILHIMCDFDIVWRNGINRVDEYDGNTPGEEFATDIKKLIGLDVLKVELREKNDLLIDFGDYWMVIFTEENDEESWRLFTPGEQGIHLVASAIELDLNKDDCDE